MKYRLNYGNGQVSQTFPSKQSAMRARTSLVEWARGHRQPGHPIRIQFQDPDTEEWFDCGGYE